MLSGIVTRSNEPPPPLLGLPPAESELLCKLFTDVLGEGKGVDLVIFGLGFEVLGLGGFDLLVKVADLGLLNVLTARKGVGDGGMRGFTPLCSSLSMVPH